MYFPLFSSVLNKSSLYFILRIILFKTYVWKIILCTFKYFFKTQVLHLVFISIKKKRVLGYEFPIINHIIYYIQDFITYYNTESTKLLHTPFQLKKKRILIRSLIKINFCSNFIWFLKLYNLSLFAANILY